MTTPWQTRWWDPAAEPRPGARVRVGARELPLCVGSSVPAEHPPDRARATLRCEACGAETTTQADCRPDWHDDDHITRFSVGGQVGLHAPCRSCGAPLEAALLWEWEERRHVPDPGTPVLSLLVQWQERGARLLAPPAYPW